MGRGGTTHMAGGSQWMSLDCSVKTGGEKGMEESHSVKESLECIEINCISRGSSTECLWVKIRRVVSMGILQ